MGRDVRFTIPDTDDGARAAPRNTDMINVIYAAARRAVPAPLGHSRYTPAQFALARDSRPGVLSRDELRRAVAEVVG